ncbi:MAG: hypothetical protein ACK559_19820, partial [bacterium]
REAREPVVHQALPAELEPVRPRAEDPRHPGEATEERPRQRGPRAEHLEDREHRLAHPRGGQGRGEARAHPREGQVGGDREQVAGQGDEGDEGKGDPVDRSIESGARTGRGGADGGFREVHETEGGLAEGGGRGVGAWQETAVGPGETGRGEGV